MRPSLRPSIKQAVIMVAIVVVVTWLYACIACHHDSNTIKEKPKTLETQYKEGAVKLKIGDQEVLLEVARSQESRAQGLMFRNKLPKNHGMLFVYDKPGLRRYWMKNVAIPLSIAFLKKDGLIINIEEMKPLVETPPYMSNGLSQFAIEMEKGWFKKHGIKAGDRITLTDEIYKIEPEPDPE